MWMSELSFSSLFLLPSIYNVLETVYLCYKKQFQTGKNIQYLVRAVQVAKIAPHIIFGKKHMNTITKNFF